MNENTFHKLCKYAESIFTCNSTIHGPNHWRQVDKNAQMLAQKTGADLLVVRLFAYFHDVCRLNDDRDLQHGPRAADKLPDIIKHLPPLTEQQISLLEYAIRHHTDGTKSDDPTIGTCWDADRLDLGRVYITPDPARMSTAAAVEYLNNSKY